MKPEHFAQVREAFAKVGAAKIEAHRCFLLSPENPRQPQDVEKRLRWDVLYSALGTPWICGLYNYLDDTHIDTAAKTALAEVLAAEKLPAAN